MDTPRFNHNIGDKVYCIATFDTGSGYPSWHKVMGEGRIEERTYRYFEDKKNGASTNINYLIRFSEGKWKDKTATVKEEMVTKHKEDLKDILFNEIEKKGELVL